MAYPQHQAVPGSTAYYTLPNVGGFYAPVSRNEQGRRRGDDSSDDELDQWSRDRGSPPTLTLPQALFHQPSIAPPAAMPPQHWAYPSAPVQPHPMMPGQPQGRVFNGWKGIPDDKKDTEDTKGNKGNAEKTKEPDTKKKDKKKSSTKKSEPTVSPWQQLADSLRKRSETRRRHNRNDEDSESYSDTDVAYDYDYDNCDTPVGRRNSRSPHDQVTSSESADVKVIIQPHGSARIVVHIDDEHDEDGEEKMVAFVVSDRCLRVTAKEWPDQCHAGTRTCSIRVGCDEAVIGMYWMLHVLHHAGRENTIQHGLMGQQRDRQFQQQVALQQYLQQRAQKDKDGRSEGITDHFVYDYYHGCVGTRAVPIELPPRVLAFAVMYAVQFGVLEAWQPGSVQAGHAQTSLLDRYQNQGQGQGQNQNQNQNKGQPQGQSKDQPKANGSPYDSAFHSTANQWFQSIASTRCNAVAGRLNSVTAPSDDILFVLYAGRVLGCAPVIRLCQLTILDRWSVDETSNWFRDACGCPIQADQILPSQMAEVISMDLFSLKSARDRSLTKVADLATRLHGSIQT
ncbi:succinate dehydrogenase cytochrome b560 subunit [Ophiostoma piceae UAMH 11346]|uniref:Succinate dehydrogenase cytochrome b560 subunit n=1 Tax=Ophiostoma piceae (strain UAMH 11346) TaxID=1262450 RepID=S3CQ51_OPHP1|nr:succinate dehydrogenase cytochrome b560 subunit [Ophiostoma piceae UAMH 11346]